MALRSTIYQCELSIADVDRGYYADHVLTLALHPSETPTRLIIRLLAFALHAGPALEFGRGLSTEDEPDLWRKDPTGVIDLWIDVGLPDVRAVRKACGRARQVVVLAYGERKRAVWWTENAAAFERCGNLNVIAIDDAHADALSAMAARSMKLSCTAQDGHLLLASEQRTIELTPRRLTVASPRRWATFNLAARSCVAGRRSSAGRARGDAVAAHVEVRSSRK